MGLQKELPISRGQLRHTRTICIRSSHGRFATEAVGSMGLQAMAEADYLLGPVDIRRPIINGLRARIPFPSCGGCKGQNSRSLKVELIGSLKIRWPIVAGEY